MMGVRFYLSFRLWTEDEQTPSGRRQRNVNLKHKVSICITRSDVESQEILKGGSRSLRSRLLNLLFGNKMGVIVVTPGETVGAVEIKEIGGELNE